MDDVGSPPEWYLQQNKGPTIIATISSITALATVFVVSRIFVKGWMLRALTTDDYIIVASLVFGWLAVGFSIAAVLSGDGRHMAALTLDQISGAIMWTMIGFCPSILSISIPKFAVVTLLIKLLNPSRAHQIFLWMIVTLSGLCLCGCVVILYSQCTPTRSMWDFSITEKSCWDPWILINFSRFAAVFSGLVDLYLAVYPATVLCTLQLNWKKKVALSSALGIGVFRGYGLLQRHHLVWSRQSGLYVGHLRSHNVDMVSKIIEGGTIIIAACIPLLQPLLDLILGRRTLTSRDKSSGPRKYYKHSSKENTPHHGAGRSNEHGTELSGFGRRAGGAGARRMGKSDIDASILATKNEGGSQESILHADSNSGMSMAREETLQTSPAAVSPAAMMGGGGGVSSAGKLAGGPCDSHRDSGIIKTHEVRVEFGGGGFSQSGAEVTSPAGAKPA
ncbi:hypothetical protein MN608_04375 [Microdochium nivale]|nr:hypothetical protein MN608_04375 [Microdochium nivale]